MARHGGGNRMGKEWRFLPGVKSDMTANATFIGSSLAFTSAATVLRMIGEYVIAPTSAPTALDEVIIAAAIGVVSSDAAAVGSSAMPDPNAEPEYPWLYWASHDFYFPGADPEAAIASASVRKTFDIRSMRKIKPRESLVWVFQYADGTGTPPMTLGMGNVRILVGLH